MMDSQKDAFGQEILAYLNGKESYEIVERDDGFVGLSGGAQDYFKDFKNWPRHQKKAIKFAKGRVLDIGTGAGRVSLHLQKQGLKVMAIDNSPLAIKICKKRGVKDARILPIEKIGIFKPRTFDTVVMYGNNFGLFRNSKKAKILLKQLYKITNQNALIIAESLDPYNTNDPAHLSYHEFNRKRGRMSGQFKIRVRFRNYIGDWFDYLLVSKKEMQNILRNTGWRVKNFIDSDSYMYIALIEKIQN